MRQCKEVKREAKGSTEYRQKQRELHDACTVRLYGKRATGTKDNNGKQPTTPLAGNFVCQRSGGYLERSESIRMSLFE